jgi:hypothetical protein
MKWDRMRGKVRYDSALTNLKTLLELKLVDFWDFKEERLIPYLTVIMEWIDKKLFQIGGTDTELLRRLKEVYRLFDYGNNKIMKNSVMDLVYEMEISTKEDITPDYIPFNKDYFIFTWTNFLSSLCIRIKFQYISLFQNSDPNYGNDNPCNCPRNQDFHDWESWRSDVYPDDEDYDRTNWNKTNDAWGGTSWHSYVKEYRVVTEKDE